ncbi:tRNA epoxyqueuosine(34) reductase QueG [bacterium]|nr:tRNA epoxyqueuosine(34) reductase QueG [bacterium]MDB4770850.1 tRNA epoxyqueuosine(34) reductase QueG [bacterium]
MNNLDQLVRTLRQAATELGFSQFGITPAVSMLGYPDLIAWIDAGYAGEMNYFANRQKAYEHPDGVLDGAKSMIALAYPYDAASAQALAAGEGRIAKYIWSGLDYHDIIHPKLKYLCKILTEHSPESLARGVVDTAPLMEREIAQQAGLGWPGKNTLLLNKYQGSYFFLACVLTNIELPYDESHDTQHCGNCRACLDACPTDAFPAPGVLDATRCISYLTIEHRNAIPVALREGIGNWLFGCDVCQEVCPWNRKPTRQATQTQTDGKSTNFDHLDLRTLFEIGEEEFRLRFRKTPLWRARRRGILRNAAIVLGNQKHEANVPALKLGLRDTEPLVRGASAWALGRVGGQIAGSELESCLISESDPDVLGEINLALSTIQR